VSEPAYFVTGEPQIELLPEGATITIPSGDTAFRFGLSRHHARMLVERGRILLDDADRNQEQNIVELRRKRAPKKGGARG